MEPPHIEEKSTQHLEGFDFGESSFPTVTSSPNSGTIEFIHRSAPFIAKLFSLVDTPEYSNFIRWSEEHKGNAIEVIEPVQFSQEILPKIFKHSNITSFIRQLNIYGFHKLESKEGLCFKHEFFRRGHPELLDRIKRRKGKKDIQQHQNIFMNETAVKKDEDLLSTVSIRMDLAKLQSQVEAIHATVDQSNAKWSALARRIDQIDQFLSMFYASYQPQPSQTAYFTPVPQSGPAPLRRPGYFPQDMRRHEDES